MSAAHLSLSYNLDVIPATSQSQLVRDTDPQTWELTLTVGSY